VITVVFVTVGFVLLIAFSLVIGIVICYAFWKKGTFIPNKTTYCRARALARGGVWPEMAASVVCIYVCPSRFLNAIKLFCDVIAANLRTSGKLLPHFDNGYRYIIYA